MSSRLNEKSAIFHSYITVKDIPNGLEFEANWVESKVFLDCTNLPFGMHGRDKEIVKIYECDDYITMYVRTDCYCDAKEVDYAILEQKLATKKLSKENVLNSDYKVRTDIKGDVILKTDDDYKEYDKGTVIVSFYEINN